MGLNTYVLTCIRDCRGECVRRACLCVLSSPLLVAGSQQFEEDCGFILMARC